MCKYIWRVHTQFEDSAPWTYLVIACVYCFLNQNHAQHGQGILHLLHNHILWVFWPPPLIFVIIFSTECNLFHEEFEKNVTTNYIITGKSLSEALLFAEHGENMLCTKIVLNVRNNFCTQHVFPRFELGIFMYWTCNSMNNLLSYCGLVDAKIRASDKDFGQVCFEFGFLIIY